MGLGPFPVGNVIHWFYRLREIESSHLSLGSGPPGAGPPAVGPAVLLLLLPPSLGLLPGLLDAALEVRAEVVVVDAPGGVAGVRAGADGDELHGGLGGGGGGSCDHGLTGIVIGVLIPSFSENAGK